MLNEVDRLNNAPVDSPEERGAIWLVPETRAVLDSMTEFFIALDANYDLVFANQALESARPGLVGQNHWDLWPDMRGTAVETRYRDAFRTRIPCRFEYEYATTGTTVDVSAYPVGDYLHVYFRDVTLQHRADEQLRAMVDGFPQIAWASDAAHRPIYLNRRWYEYTGRPREEPYEPGQVVHPDDLARIQQAVARTATDGESLEAEIRLRRHDGVFRWHLMRMEPYRTARGEIRGWFGTSTDIHELHETREEMARILNMMGDGLLALDPNWRIIRLNERAEEHFGVRQHDVIGRTLTEALPKIIGQPHLQLFEDAQKLGQTASGEFPSLFRAGWVHIRAHPHEGGIVVTFTDVTSRHEAEESLRRTSDAVPVLLSYLDKDLVYRFCNRAYVEMFRRPRAEFEGRHIRDAVGEQAYASAEPFLRRALDGEEISYSSWIDYPKIGRRFVNVLYRPDFSQDGSVRGIHAMVLDETDRHLAEETISAQASLLELAHDAIIVHAPTGEIRYWNRSAEQKYGWPREEALGRNIHELLRTEADEPFPSLRARIIREGAWEGELRQYRRDGSALIVSSKWVVHRNEAGEPLEVLEINRDITSERQALQRLRESERHQRFVVQLGDAMRNADSVEGILAVACEMTAREFRAARSAYTAVDAPNDRLRVVHAVDREGIGEITGEYRLSSFGDALLNRYRSGEPVVIEDTAIDESTQVARAEIMRTWKARATLSIPLMNEGEWAATFSLHSAVPRRWLPAEIALLQDAGERVRDAVDRARSAEELRASEQRLRIVIDSNPIGVIVARTDTGEVHMVNDAYLQILGYRRNDFSQGAINWREVTPPEWLPVDEAKIAEARRTGRSVFYEKEYFRADGSRVPVYIGFSYFDAEQTTAAAFVLDLSERKAAEVALRESGERLATAVSVAKLGVWDVDVETGAVHFDDRCLEVFGFEKDAVLSNADVDAVIHPEDLDYVRRQVARALDPQGNGEYEAEYRVLREDGTQRWVAVRASAISVNPDAEPRFQRFVGTLLDITDRKASAEALAASEQLYRTTTEIIPQIVVLCDPRGAITWANSEWSRYFGAGLADRPEDYALVHPEDRQTLVSTMSASFADPGPYEVILRLLRHDGEWRWFHGQVRPIFDSHGVLQGWVGSYTDIHDRKEMEAELERRVEERTRQLNVALEQMQTFTYHVSHDLRAPLRAIVATSRIVQEDFGALLPTPAQDQLDRQVEAGRRLGQLIDDLLKLSRLSREQIQRSRISLTEIGRECAYEAAAQHPESTVRITVADDLWADADPRLMKLAIANLIENAVKYSPDGGSVHFGRAGNAFVVSDQGIGIETQYLQRVFEPFQRLHRDEEFSGTGIGLANVRQVIERHGGRIWAESEFGQGSRFFFTLGE